MSPKVTYGIVLDHKPTYLSKNIKAGVAGKPRQPWAVAFYDNFGGDGPSTPIRDGFDGPRVIYEVGCDTVIYLNTDRRKTGRYELYVQHMDGFIFDVTQRSVAAKVVEATKSIKTIVKYEMY